MRTFLICFFLSISLAPELPGAEVYKHGPDSEIQPDVPRGKVTQHRFTSSQIFPGTERDYWVYVPSQYKAGEPACVMIFQDGGGYLNEKGDWRVPIVFDNLIHKKEMPVTLGIFINPGVVPAATPNALPRYNRSFEYDGLGDRYARFLLEEILPEVGKTYSLTNDPNGRAICGASSGGICAFNAAWERPDGFRRVYCTIGTFVGLRGGHNLQLLVRKSEPKPMRIFLQDGSNDLNIYGGNWWLANQEMLSSLELAGYDVKHAWGDGGHDGKQGGAILPDVLRWLWREYPKPVEKPRQSRLPVMEILIPGEEWEMVGEGYRFTEGPAVNEAGEVFFTDIPNNRIHKISLDGKVSVFKENSGGCNGLMFGPDGKLYGCQNGKKQVVAYGAGGEETVVATDIESNDLAISHRGHIYVTDPNNKRVWLILPGGEKKVVDTGLEFPNGIRLTPDQSLLLVADMRGQFVWSYQVQEDGSLKHKQPYHHLHLQDGVTQSGADGMTVDTLGRLYVTSHAGLQVCDQAGRVMAILAKPQPKWLANVVFGGADLKTLYVTASDKVYRRKTKAQGVLPFKAPIKPPAPRL